MAYSAEMGRIFWYEFDKATLYAPSFMAIAGRAGAGDVQDQFAVSRTQGTYPQAFVQEFEAQRADWVSIADMQITKIAAHLANDWANVQGAFEDFAQGILLDDAPERRARNDSIHMMDGQTSAAIVGYHRWHASIRLIQLLGIGDPNWWENLDRLLGLGWGIQSFARPQQRQDTPNPRIPASDLQDLRSAWLALDAGGRDRQYDLTPSGNGFHPSPKQPA